MRAVADADEVGEAASLLHTASGGGYGGVSGTLRVRVSDDDLPPAPPPPPPPENRPPVVVGSLADLDLDVGESASVRLGGVFADDGPLSHWAESSDGAVASARVEGNSMLRVSGLSPGAAVVTVWAADVEGQRAQLSFRVSVGRVLSFDPASAPEGGTLRLRLSLSRPAGEALSVSWTALPDSDAATADADAAGMDALSGTVEFAAEGVEAFIDLAVREDAEVEPVREVLRVELSPPPSPTGEPQCRHSPPTATAPPSP